MGDCHGSLCFFRWDVSQLRRPPRHAPSPSRRYLRQRLPTPSGSFVGGIDETAAQDHARACHRRSKTRAVRGRVMTTAQLAEKIKERFPNLSQTEFRDEISVQVPLEQIELACKICRDELGFDFLVDISSVDHFGEEPRFEIVYEFYSLGQNIPLRLKTKVSEERLEVPTISRLWEGANWHEREIFDMMGIRFANHPDLRRILMWDGYPYFPLRKDFPLEGKPSDMPDVAFSDVAPLAGGPFVPAPTDTGTKDREPRARPPE